MFESLLELKYYIFFMSRKITTVISFKIESPFEEWVLILDLPDNNYLKCIGIHQY